MTVAVLEASARERVVAQFRAAVDALCELELATVADGELLELLREIEVERRRLAGVDLRLVAELDQRGLAFERGCRGTAALLMRLLRVDAGEATARVAAAQELAPRVGVSGEALEPIFPAVAGAVECGSISSVHARIVTETVEALPADVQAERGVQIEAWLVAEAQKFGPRDLRLIARRLLDTYDQDGRAASDEDRARKRFLDVREHADGTVSGSFHTDAVTGQALLAAVDAGSKPQPAADGTPDPRTAGQRRHDALRDLLLLALRSGALPAAGGVTTTIVLTMSPEQFTRARCGTNQTDESTVGRPRGPTGQLVRTARGALMNLNDISPLLGDAQVFPVVLDASTATATPTAATAPDSGGSGSDASASGGVGDPCDPLLGRVLASVRGIHAYGTLHRIFTEGQRLAMAARDHGCSFPGCTVPPAWCQAHHVVAFAEGGPTSVANGTLLCGVHHREFQRLGHTCTMLDGIPHWTAPAWLDPTQTPQRNTAHTAGA